MPVVSVPEKMLIKTGTLTTCRIPIKSLRLAARTVTPATYDRQFDCPSSQSINLNQFVKNNRPAACRDRKRRPVEATRSASSVTAR